MSVQENLHARGRRFCTKIAQFARKLNKKVSCTLKSACKCAVVGARDRARALHTCKRSCTLQRFSNARARVQDSSLARVRACKIKSCPRSFRACTTLARLLHASCTLVTLKYAPALGATACAGNNAAPQPAFASLLQLDAAWLWQEKGERGAGKGARITGFFRNLTRQEHA